MTFKGLQKAIQSQAAQIGDISNLDAKLQGLPLWIFDKEQYRRLDIDTKGQCCFWHIIGLLQKDGHDMPLLPPTENTIRFTTGPRIHAVLTYAGWR